MPATNFAPRHSLTVAAALTVALLATLHSFAQAISAPDDPRPSHVDIYGGYGYIHPFHSAVAGVPYHDVGNLNTTVSIADYFTRHLGVQVEGSYFSGGSKRGITYQCTPSCAARDQLFYAAEAGPIVRFPAGRFTPYVHVLAGGAKVNGPYAQPLTWGAGLTGGGGLDYTLPFAGNRLAIRLFQADMYYSHVNYPRSTNQTSTNGSVAGRSNVGDVIAIKGSAGLVFKLGSIGPPPVPLTLACTVQPETAYPGDTVALACTPGNLDPKRKADYSYTSSGGRATGTGTSGSVSTAGLAPGSYMVMARLTQGPKPWQQASWTGSFNLRNFDPPMVTACTATPAEITAGDTSTITVTAASPQNRSLTYSYATPSGRVSGSGSTATFSSDGVAPGVVTVTCSVTDDQGRSSSASTMVTILGQHGIPSIGTGTGEDGKGRSSDGQCSISFERDRKRPVRVNNEAKGCLDGIALSLRVPTDKLVITGHQEPREPPQTAAQRARNESLYLIQEKGIDPGRLELRATTTGGRSVDNMRLHLGASSPQSGSTLVDPSTLPQGGEAYGRPHPHTPHRKARRARRIR